MTNPTGYPVIDGILESIAPPATSPNGADINARLDDLAHDLCYQSIRWSGLYKELSNDQWDALAERLRAQVRTFVEGEIDNELARLETERNNNK